VTALPGWRLPRANAESASRGWMHATCTGDWSAVVFLPASVSRSGRLLRPVAALPKRMGGGQGHIAPVVT
jgi:hypothetical protein